jgi:transposase
MVSKAHRYGVSRLAKASSRWILECVMEQPTKPSQPRRKKIPVVEVHVMFEPSRLAQQCLQDAYACLIPTVRRRLNASLPKSLPEYPGAERNAQ